MAGLRWFVVGDLVGPIRRYLEVPQWVVQQALPPFSRSVAHGSPLCGNTRPRTWLAILSDTFFNLAAAEWASFRCHLKFG